ncbi:MAG TPA: NACHT domain-containing protein [Ktedonobacteraceae bacterium]|nr:NACHT domain-containing protein [Ktedonobacteraceae bacterium]
MRHWTQANLADELYQLCSQEEYEERERGIINANMVGGWERGEHTPSPFWQKKLCTLFGTTPDNLGFLEKSPVSQGGRSRYRLMQQQPASSSWLESSFDELALYLKQQQQRLSYAQASGSTYLRVGDIISEQGLFIAPLWQNEQGDVSSQNLTDYLISTLLYREHILLLGDAGQGKTTLLKQVFSRMVDCFLNASPEYPSLLPFYIPLREFYSFAGDPVDVLWSHIGEEFPLPYEAFAALVRERQVVFFFDGFDEIKGEITQRLINERATSKVFSFPSILACRKSFFDTYLSLSPLQDCYPRHVELQPLALTDAVLGYIRAFCERKQTLAPEKIIEAIQASRELQDLVKRPLLLLMVLEVFTTSKGLDGGKWNVTGLYRKYTEQWLKNEASKPDSVLRWNEKALVLQEVAWFTYRTSFAHQEQFNEQAVFSHEELSVFVKTIASRHPGVTELQLLDDLCFRTLLTVSEGENYMFLHKSFQEYYIARHILDCMRRAEQDHDTLAAIEHIFQVSLPFDIATFLKEMLKDSTFYEKECITTNLMNVYQRNRSEDQRLTTIRQQASHYLTSLGTERAIQFLEQACESESDKWVQRGIMVGLGLYSGRAEILDRYLQMIREDEDAAMINIKYHLVYYGDLAQHFKDVSSLQSIDACGKTVQALFRHLQDERYRNGWPLDMLTLSTLLEMQGTSIIHEYAWQLSFLNMFLNQEHPNQSDIFRQEKNRLKKLIEGAQSWN